VLDTDHVTLHFRGHSQLGQKLGLIPPDEIATTTISAEEQLRGRLAQMKNASTTEALAMAHQRFRQAIYDLAKLNILELDPAAIRNAEDWRRRDDRQVGQGERGAGVGIARRRTVLDLKRGGWGVSGGRQIGGLRRPKGVRGERGDRDKGK